MEAKDTVIKINHTNRRKTLQEKLLEQAEITWSIAFKAGLEQGRKEVVEWVKGRTPPDGFHIFIWGDEAEWHLKLKEWGIE